VEGVLDQKRGATENGGERHGEVDVPVLHALRRAAPGPGDADAYDTGGDHKHGRNQELAREPSL
jgi:hypothetical protein